MRGSVMQTIDDFVLVSPNNMLYKWVVGYLKRLCTHLIQILIIHSFVVAL